MLRWVLAVVAIMLSTAARADGPVDTVTWIYTSLEAMGPAESKGLAYLSAPERRDQYLSARLAALYDANDTYVANQLPPCIPFAFDVPAETFSPREIARSLTVSSEDKGGRRRVTASFTLNGELTRIAYDFSDEGGFWKIDDIAGADWRVSRLSCKPQGAEQAEREAKAQKGEDVKGPAYTAGAASFCYKSPGDFLVMDVAEDGGAQFRLESVQPGSKCEAEGTARWTGEGWVYEAALDGGACRMEILVTTQQGLRLTDRGDTCRITLCGPNANIEGLNFPRSSQIDCALLQRE